MLSRRWTRHLVKLVGASIALTLVVIFTDVYFYYSPRNVHTLVLADTVLTDIKVVSCHTRAACTAEARGGWEQVPKDFYLNKKWTKHAYVYVKHKKQESVEGELVVKDVVVDPKEMDKEDGWVQRGLLWVKYGKLSKTNNVLGVDVLYDRDAVDPRPGWQLKQGYIDPSIESRPRLTVRNQRIDVETPILKVPENGKYKILQIADLHLATGVGKCVDPLPEYAVGCEADIITIHFVERLLDEIKPDFVVLTGDQIYGHESPDSPTAMLKAVGPLIDRKIPYAMIFGNHDDEGSLNRVQLMDYVEKLPYCLSSSGPQDIAGVGNFVLQVANSNNKPAMTFYFLDTHKRLPNQKKTPGYDHIKQNQLDWVKSQYEKLKSGQDKSQTHLSMAFLHIPLPEYVHPGVKHSPFIGSFSEGSTAPRFNSGARDVLVNADVSVIGVGHDHVNDFCRYNDQTELSKGKVWLCHGGAIGEGGYGGYDGFVRRARVFEVDTASASIASWKIKNEQESRPFDYQMLVQNGQAIAP